MGVCAKEEPDRIKKRRTSSQRTWCPKVERVDATGRGVGRYTIVPYDIFDDSLARPYIAVGRYWYRMGPSARVCSYKVDRRTCVFAFALGVVKIIRRQEYHSPS